MSKDHVEQVYRDYFIPHYNNDPRVLQHKVYFDITYFLGKRGTKGLRELTKDSFIVKVTDNGHEYLELMYNEAKKKSQDDGSNESNAKNSILSQPGNPCCPVNSFKLYISKLHPKCNAFFQNINTYYKLATDKWYKNSPASVNTIGNFLCTISQASSLSYICTNHYIGGLLQQQ